MQNLKLCIFKPTRCLLLRSICKFLGSYRCCYILFNCLITVSYAVSLTGQEELRQLTKTGFYHDVTLDTDVL